MKCSNLCVTIEESKLKNRCEQVESKSKSLSQWWRLKIVSKSKIGIVTKTRFWLLEKNSFDRTNMRGKRIASLRLKMVVDTFVIIDKYGQYGIKLIQHCGGSAIKLVSSLIIENRNRNYSRKFVHFHFVVRNSSKSSFWHLNRKPSEWFIINYH